MKDYKVELFTLCQGAYNMEGHLTIVNTIDEFVVPQLPVRLSFGLALKLYIRPNVEGEKHLLISIINKKNDTNLKFPQIPFNLQIEKKETASHINIALNLQNVLFETSGVYDVHLEIDGKRFDDFAFEIIQNEE